jgi:hypothetical protein
MKMDYRNVQDNMSFIEPGKYNVEIYDVVQEFSEKVEHEIWKITFKIVKDCEFYGRKISDNIIFMENLAQRNKSIFRALGYNVDSEELDVEPNDLLKKRVQIEIVKETYEKDGQTKETRKVKFFDGWMPENEEENSIPF